MNWKQKSCGCVNTTLPASGKVTIRCEHHRGKPTKKGRLLCHFEDGMVRRG